MNFKVVCITSDKLRLRFGKYIFTKKQGYTLSALLFAIEGVSNVITNESNGSILINYSGDNTCNKIFELIKNIDINNIADGQPSETQTAIELKSDFENKIISLALKHLLVKLATSTFLPKLVGNLHTVWRSRNFVKNGFNSISKGKLTVEILDATSIAVAIASNNFPTASSVMFLLTLSEQLLEYSNLRVKNALADSLAINIDTVWTVVDGVDVSIPISKLCVGDDIRVRMGSMIPIDGTVLEGDASVNEAMITGESLPVHKKSSNSVFAGTVIEEGELVIKVRELVSTSRISKIIQLIDNGEDNKANIQGNAERIADGIVPVSFGLFFATLLLTRNVSKAISVLMVDFSCAIKLTTPLVIINAIRQASQEKILVKGGKYLETLANVDTVVFDKTGTLTNAVPEVSNVICLDDSYTRDDVLRISACLEEHFPHSVASAIVKYANDNGISHPEEHEKVSYIVAHGVASSYDDKTAIIGSYHFVFEDEKVEFPNDKKEFMENEIGNDSAVYLAVAGKLIGVVCINDPPRADAKEMIQALKDNGINDIIMITGDSENNARYVSNDLNIDKYFANVLPDEKADIINELKSQGKTVLMIGDGINDTPALSCANVSMALKGSSDVAREVADISIHSEELMQIIYAMQLSQKLMNRISNNYKFIIIFNSILIALGILGVVGANQTALYHNLSTFGLAGFSATNLLNKHEVNEDETT